MSEEFLNKVSTSLIEVANAYEDGQMGVWDTFIATFWANIAALAIFAIPGLAVWAFFRDRNNRIRRWWHRFKRNVSLKVRFGWLVLRGKRKKTEYGSWSRSERIRMHILKLLSEGPKGRSHIMNDLQKHLLEIATSAIDTLYSRPALDVLIEAGESLTLDELTTPLESESCPDKAKWILTNSLRQLAVWSLRLDDQDRKEWMAWLDSQDSTAEIESATSNHAEKPASQDSSEFTP